MTTGHGLLLERVALHDRSDVFEDRVAGGRALAELIREAALGKALLLAIPSGGVPVACAMARELGWRVDVAVVSKITLPWNGEAGYGAVAFDGSVLLNDALVRECALSRHQVELGIEATRRKVERRVGRLRAGRGALQLDGACVALVDDGIASGFTMRAAVRACRRAGAQHLTIAAPTGHARAIDGLRAEVDCIVCPNIRASVPFAVADAYRRWCDVPEVEAELELERLG